MSDPAPKNQKHAMLFGLSAVLLWSTVATAFKLSLQVMTPTQLLAWSGLFSTLVLAVFVTRHALIMRNKGDIDAALESAWLAFESLKTQPHLVLYLHTLAALGSILTEKGEVLQARLYLELAERSLKRTEFPRIARIVDSALGKLESTEPKTFDLRFIEATETLIESQKGEIRFDGQHILRDLLKVLLKSPGQTVGKADLVRQVWKETYTPETHDNKIYVNIKRLRRLIESEDGSTEYILRGKSGYYLNPKAHVQGGEGVLRLGIACHG